MITILQTVPDFALLTEVSKIVFTSSQARVAVTLKLGQEEILSETYVPDATGKITLRELDLLLEGYLTTNLVETFTLTMTDSDETKTQSFKVLFCKTDIPTFTAASFTANYFLTMLSVAKEVQLGWTEYLHLYSSAAVDVVATCTYYDNGSGGFAVVNKPVKSITELEKVVSVDVSPELFDDSERGALVAYTITAGARTMLYTVYENQDCAPCLLFTNSFGCQETLYCKGTHKLEPEYDRAGSYIDGLYRNYDIEEKKVFKANTGILSTAMSNWADDLFRSKEIYILDGTTVGKEVTVTEAKAVRSNDPNALPSFEFEYQYAQRNHNVLQLHRAGRIFDNTFDRTFE